MLRIGKARNHVHHNLKKIILLSWTEAAGYDGRNAAAGAFLKGQRYFLESTGLREVPTAYVAAASDCGGGLDQQGLRWKT